MLNPSMGDLMKKVGNRYLLVNLAAKRARDIAIECEEEGDILTEKPVKLALEDIVDDRIELSQAEEEVKPLAIEDIFDM